MNLYVNIDGKDILVNKNINPLYDNDVTVINNLMIKHNGFKILFAKCLVSGKFVKHSIAINALMSTRVEWLKTIVVLFSCVLMNVLAVGYTVLWSV